MDDEPRATPRNDLTDLVRDIDHLEEVIAGWEDTPRRVVEAYRRALDALHAEALRRLLRALKGDPAAFAALKQAASDDVVYAVLRHHELVKPSINERVEAALASVRPMLAAHGGDVRLIAVAPPRIEVELVGSCGTCASSTQTFHAGVKQAVQEACPEIVEIVQVSGAGHGAPGRFVSPFALDEGGTWHTACVVADLAENELRRLLVGGRQIILYREGASITCFEDACAHLGLAIGDGAVREGIVTCRHHGFEYDLKTGECINAPEVQLQSHAVRIVGGKAQVRLDR